MAVLLDILGVIALIGVVIIGAKHYSGNHSSNKMLKSVPAPALGAGDVPIAQRLTFYYRLAQKSVRLLEHLQEDYTVSPMISPEDKIKIKRIIADFYEEKE